MRTYIVSRASQRTVVHVRFTDKAKAMEATVHDAMIAGLDRVKADHYVTLMFKDAEQYRGRSGLKTFAVTYAVDIEESDA